jgi:hypothetical protein
VVVAPPPVISLLAVIGVVELVVLVVSSGQIHAVGAIFAIVPLVVILVVAIIVTSVISVADNDFLRGGGFGGQRDDKCSSGEKQSGTLNGSLHKFSVDRELQGRVVAYGEYADGRRQRLCVCGQVKDSRRDSRGISWCNTAPLARRLLFSYLTLATMTMASALGQEPTKTPPAKASEPDAVATEPDNKHVQVVRYQVAAHEVVALPAVEHESVLICLRGNFHRSSEDHAEEYCEAGGALWGRGGAAYSLRNTDAFPAEFLRVELKDSYASGQEFAPQSQRDPVASNPRSFRILLENEHVRLSRLRLLTRQGTIEGQFRMRLEIPLQSLRAEVLEVDGKNAEVAEPAGSATWRESGKIFSIVNRGEQGLDLLILELKHPFCYASGDNSSEVPPGTDPAMEAYVKKVYSLVRKSWLKHMPHDAKEGQKGLVVLRFQLQRDGTLREDDIRVEREFASEILLEKSLAALRQSAPFPAFPAGLTEPEIVLTYTFQFSLTPHPEGCP